MIIVKNADIVLRDIGGVCFLIDIKRKYNSGNRALVEINDIGRLVWNSIDTCKTVDGIVDNVVSVCGIPQSDEPTVKSDILSFLRYLRDLGYVDNE